MNPKVVFAAPSAYVLSGLATWLDYLIPGLVQSGWNARLLLVSGRHHHQPARYLSVHPGTQVLVAHCQTETAAGRRRALQEVLAKVQPDIAVSVNIPDIFPAANQLRADRQWNGRLAMSVHGIERFLFADMQAYSKCLDGTICTNRLACELADRLGTIPTARILYAPCGADSTPEAALRPPTDRLRIAYSGRLEGPQKRSRDLIFLVRSLDSLGVPFLLDIAGDGPEMPALEQALTSEKASGAVVFRGRVAPEVLRDDVYAQAHALIITSHWETGPIVAWEAMAQGVCVVSSRYVGSGRETALVHEENAMLFEIGDMQEAALSMQLLWNSPTLRARIVNAGKDLIGSRYSIERSVASWDAALRRVLAMPPAPHQMLEKPPARGRLDKWQWLSPDAAEKVRRLLPDSRRLPAADPGGEWPHAHNAKPSDAAFWKLAQGLDRDYRLPAGQA